jgi:hypothetical protein
MPSGKRAKQQRRAAAASGGQTPPPVRSRGGGSRTFGLSKRTFVIAGVALVGLIALGVGLPLAFTGGAGAHPPAAGTAPLTTLGRLRPAPPLGPPGPETSPIESGPKLAPAGSLPPGASIDGIQCQRGEQVALHIHARLTIFVDGHPKSVPYGIGILDPQTAPTGVGPFVVGGACFSWLHTHAADGIIHIESPVQRVYTLGNFFDIWGQPLSKTQVGPAKGNVTALVDGKVWVGDPGDIPLNAHSQIQLEVGKPLVAPVHITNWGGL